MTPRALARRIVQDARSRGGLLLFTHYENALCGGPSDRRRGGLPLLVRGALVALAGTPCTRVVIVSGQDACDLETHVNIPGVIYAGCRGLQIRGAGMSFCHPAARRLRDVLPVLAQNLSDRLAPLSGVEVEIKEVGITVHVRQGDPTIVHAIVPHAEALRRTAAGEFRVWRSDSAVDLFPDVDGHNGSSAHWILGELVRDGQDQPAVVCLGDDAVDDTDPPRGSGCAIRVGRQPGASAASCWTVDPEAATDLLGQIAFAWGAGSSSR